MKKVKVPSIIIVQRGPSAKKYRVVNAFNNKTSALNLANTYVNKEAAVQYHPTAQKWLVGVRPVNK